MKKLIVLLITAGLFTAAQAQRMDKDHMIKEKESTSNNPAAMITAFNTSHVEVKDVDWKKEGTTYTAEYDMPDKMDMYITYDATGKLVRSKQEIADKELPAAVMAY